MKGAQNMDAKADSSQNAADAAAAVRWFHRFLHTDVETLPAEELADWAAWSEVEPHLEQFRMLKRIWGMATHESGPRPTEADVASDEYDGSLPYREWLAQGSKRRNRWRPSRFTVVLAMTACVIATTAVVVKYRYWLSPQRLFGGQIQSYTTGPSELRNIELPDGSHITLGGRTEISVHYTTNRRFIFLNHGEAWFSVVHDPQHPFTVLAGGGAVTAIGTQFDVRRDLDPRDGGRVVVTVDSGVVEVGPPMAAIAKDIPESVEASVLKQLNQPVWTSARLVKGQELTYGPDGLQGKIERVNLEEVAAWKEGRLEYRHTPFRVVIPRVNRYSQKPIVLADERVAELPYSGTVFEGQVDDWLHALQTSYPVQVTETPDHFLLHYSRERDKAGE
jgi:transmembrane sensor